jgi:hypothetical protein
MSGIQLGRGASRIVACFAIAGLASLDRSVLCSHDERNYRQTFHRTLLPLLRRTEPDARSFGYVVSMNDATSVCPSCAFATSS